MCLATLNVTSLACAHRWYALHTPCVALHTSLAASPLSLSACVSKLALQGWERKHATCAICAPSAAQPLHVLNASNLPLTRTRLSRSSSGGSGGSGAGGTAEGEGREERMRRQRERLDAYFRSAGVGEGKEGKWVGGGEVSTPEERRRRDILQSLNLI